MPETQLTPESFDFEKLFATRPGEDLPSDGPADDRTDSALQAREAAYRQAGDLNWLLEGSQKPAGESDAGDESQPAGEGENAPTGLLGAIAHDMASGLPEMPRQIVGGMRDAVQSLIDMGDELERGHIPFTDIPTALGGVTFSMTGGIGGPSIKYHSPDEWKALVESGEVNEPDLPTVGESRTMTGNAFRSVAQFIR